MQKKYLRMIRVLEAGTPQSGEADWSVYILRCGDGSLYTGIAKDVEARVKSHNAGRGAAYTRSHRPVRELYREEGLTRAEALIREAKIKSLPRALKAKLARRGLARIA